MIWGLEAIEISLAFIVISSLIYYFYGRRIEKKEFALLHLLKRITDDRLTKGVLENELREVLVHRDNIEQDDFDALIKNAKVFDIEKSLNFEELLDLIAEDISTATDLPESEIKTRFMTRHQEFNSAVSSFLAIPHIVIEGKEKIFMTIIRCKNGIAFSETDKNIQAVFFLGGPIDKRVLHLKTLASIATLTGMSNFKKKWLNAEDEVELKNMMILSNRKRFN